MLYLLISAVATTLFMVIGSFAAYELLEMWLISNLPINRQRAKSVIAKFCIAFLCFIVACIAGSQIPDCYVVPA